MLEEALHQVAPERDAVLVLWALALVGGAIGLLLSVPMWVRVASPPLLARLA